MKTEKVMTHVYVYTATGRFAESTFTEERTSLARLKISQLRAGMHIVVRIRVGDGILGHFKYREYYGEILEVSDFMQSVRLQTLSAYGKNRGRLDQVLTDGDERLLTIRISPRGAVLGESAANHEIGYLLNSHARSV